MHVVHIPGAEYWDEKKEIFINIEPVTIQIEHSLISISKWEEKWHKPFLGNNDKTTEEITDYIRCMTITENVNPLVYDVVMRNDYILNDILMYIKDPMTATWFPKDEKKTINREIITSERIYYWMIEMGIPVEFQEWHLNRLLTLIRVCHAERTPPKKRSRQEIARQNAAINRARRKKYNTRG